VELEVIIPDGEKGRDEIKGLGGRRKRKKRKRK
jgi:hypothetical protein